MILRSTSENQWMVDAASTVGHSHVRRRIGCQDAYACVESGDTVAAVVCDGPGTLRQAAASAQSASQIAASFLELHAEDVVGGVVQAEVVHEVVVSRLAALAERMGEPLEDFGCTMVALLVHDGRYVTWNIGDSAAFMLQAEVPVPITQVQAGADGGTYFVTSPGATPEMMVRRLPVNATGFLLASDGAECLWKTRSRISHPFIAALVAELDMGDVGGLQTLMEEEVAPYSDDDITLLALRRRAVAGLYGCPQCGAPAESVLRSRNMRRDLLVGKCQSCDEVVFRLSGVKASLKRRKAILRQ